MSKTYGSALAELDKYLGALHKSAGVQASAVKGKGKAKAAAATSEDSTTHPVQSVDEQLHAVSEGARSAENEADITSQVGPQNINDAAPAKDEEPKPVAMTTATTTGEDPANETASVKHTKDDPGTSSPAKAGTEKDSGFLGKVKEACKMFGAEKVASELGNSILADISMLGSGSKTEKAAEAGAKAADKAMDDMIAAEIPGMVQSVIKQASADADNLAEFYASYMAQMRKKAEEEGKNPEEAVPGEEDAEAAGAAGAEGALPIEDLAQLASAAGGEGAAASVAAPEAGAPVGEPGTDEVVQALSEALQDAGITPEELAQAVASQETAGEAPIEQKMAAVQVATAAINEVNRYRNMKAAGRFPNEKKASLQVVWPIRQMIKDITGR